MGFKWAAAAGFSTGSAKWGLCLHRTPRQQPFSRPEARLLASLSDRLTEVATLACAVGRVALANAVNALDCIGKLAVAVDRFGLVLGANRLAESLFGNSVRVKDRRLVVSDAHAAAWLQRLVARLLAAPESEPVSEPPIVARAGNGRAIVIDVLPVHPAARNPFLGARALLTFSDLSRKQTFDPCKIAVIFALSPAEARLAAALAEGRSLESIAETTAVSLTTARNQLKSVFSKTDTHRQGELIALLAKL
jgi:DNA-binding CsgD family transcriptional regulator